MGFLIFTISFVILVVTSILITKSIASTYSEKFWVFIASSASHLGVISVGLSLFTQLNWPMWLSAQVFIYTMTVCVLKGFSREIFYVNVFRSLSKYSLRSVAEYVGIFLSLRPMSLVGLCLVMMFLLISLVDQIIAPISGFDERMYHASRVLYFIQNHSVFPYLTHNDRQIMFPFGSELFFLWPILFTKSELLGRVIFWFAYPLSALGLYTILHEFSISKKFTILSLLVFVSTPIVAYYSTGLKPELWLAAFFFGAGFWVVRTCKASGSLKKDLFFASFFLVLCINVKSTALLMAIPVLILPLLISRSGYIFVHFRSVFSGVCSSFLLTGCFVFFCSNLINYNHPLGSHSFRKIHSSDLTITQIYTHAVRLPFLLLEVPTAFPYNFAQSFSRYGNRIIDKINASKPLKYETDGNWPGIYSYSIPKYAKKFSIGGLIWLPALSISSVRLAREVIQTFPRVQIGPLSGLVALELPFLAGIVFLVRWMPSADVPERFLVGPYALSLVISTVLLSEFLAKRKYIQVATYVLVTWMIMSSALMRSIHLRNSFNWDPTKTDEPFTIALKYIPPGSHILLAGGQAVRDYPLFGPRDRYSNKVVSWGKLPFDSFRMQGLIEVNQVTHILIQNDQELGFHWDPPVSTREMVEWLTRQTNLRSIPLPTKGMRLFEKTDSIVGPQRAPSSSELDASRR